MSTTKETAVVDRNKTALRSPKPDAVLARVHPEKEKEALRILDLSALRRDPRAFTRFGSDDVFLPSVLLHQLEELQHRAGRQSHIAYQITEQLETIFRNDRQRMSKGVPLAEHSNGEATGRIFMQTENLSHALPKGLIRNEDDSTFVAVACELRDRRKDWRYKRVILVTTNALVRLQIASIKDSGVEVENFHHEAVQLKDSDYVPTGIHELPADFFDTHKSESDWTEEGGRKSQLWKVRGALCDQWKVNECVYTGDGTKFAAKVQSREDGWTLLRGISPYGNGQNTVARIAARNLEQRFAFSHVTDPRILCTSIVGPQGSGKNFVATLAGLDLINRQAEFAPEDQIRQIIYIRAMIPAGGEKMGFLPGDQDEKFAPWASPLECTLDSIEEIYAKAGGTKHKSDVAKLRSLCQAIPVSYIDGVTFHHSYVIVDEAEYMDRDLLKQLLTRAGNGTRYALCGSLVQGGALVDPRTCGLRQAVMHLLGHERIAHIVLNKCERSELAGIVVDRL